MALEGKKNVLSSELYEVTGIQDTTIRRDLTYLSKDENFGKPGKGYSVKHLIDGLSQVFGVGLESPIILFGVGNLGSDNLEIQPVAVHSWKNCRCYDMDRNKEGDCSVSRYIISMTWKRHSLQIVKLRFLRSHRTFRTVTV